MGPNVRNSITLPQSGANLIGTASYPTRGFVFTYSQPVSCLDLYNLGARTSGAYTLPAGSVYCDMSAATGGGWTLVAMMSSAASDNTWAYSALVWSNAFTINPTTSDINTNVNMKNTLYSSLPVANIRFVFGLPSDTNQGFNVPLNPMATVAATMAGGTITAPTFTRANFNTVINNVFGSAVLTSANSVWRRSEGR